MSEEKVDFGDPRVEMVKRLINEIAYDMKDDRHDGYVKHYHRGCLLELRDHILEKLSK